MGRFLELLYRYRNFLLFLALELLAFTILNRYNNEQAAVYSRWVQGLTGSVQSSSSQLTGYFELSEQNRRLSRELLQLRRLSDSLRNQVAQRSGRRPGPLYLPPKPDSAREKEEPLPPATAKRFRYMPCRAVHNTITQSYNHLVLNVGRRHGVEPEMGVVSATGVVGMTTVVSENYSLAMSLLNKNFRLSAKIRSKSIMGTLTWEGGSSERAVLKHIPLHYSPAVGDTVVTSNYSTIFPEGFVIGTVKEIRKGGKSGFYQIVVALKTEFNRLDRLYVVHTRQKAEIDSLLQQIDS